MIKADFIRSLGLGRLANFEGTIRGAEIDTRKLQPGTAFFALKGENSDGHNYIRQALQNGAALCVVTEDWAVKNPFLAPLWIVPDPQIALQKLSEKWRLSFSIPILAITGTNGKTTTRAMCAAILQTTYHLHTTTGNFNNQLGLPLTLLNLEADHEFSLIEMGTNHFGEIAGLCNMAHPDSGLITNVAHGHLEFFGDLEGVARAKSELFTALPPVGTAFINADDPLIARMPVPCRKISYGFAQSDVDFRGKITGFSDNGCARININSKIEIRLLTPGKVAALNALAASAVALHYGVDEKALTTVLATFQSVNQRFVQFNLGPYHIINDAYNANPDSTIAALETFRKIKTPGRRIFIMGDMLELGQYSSAGHSRVGQAVATAAIDRFYSVGKMTAHATSAAVSAGMRGVYHFDTKSDLLAALKTDLKNGDTLLVKGSRGSHMEEIIEGLKV